MLPQLYDVLISCVDFHGQIIPSLKEKASACTMALSHLYCGRVLQAYPDRGEFLGCGRRDYEVFDQMRGLRLADHAVLVMAKNLCLPGNPYGGFTWFRFWLEQCPDSVFEWLSHSLPYHFVTGQVDAKLDELAIIVISKLLCSPCSPSTQTVANCTLLACVMVEVQVDKKDIVRIDKRCS
ncbi:hypothetical protein F4604DRAFT_82476 [Suillus subluteus]|nr:hypothetical protein F4604DRAFT_82476 [Suillus subluteus]